MGVDSCDEKLSPPCLCFVHTLPGGSRWWFCALTDERSGKCLRERSPPTAVSSLADAGQQFQYCLHIGRNVLTTLFTWDSVKIHDSADPVGEPQEGAKLSPRTHPYKEAARRGAIVVTSLSKR